MKTETTTVHLDDLNGWSNLEHHEQQLVTTATHEAIAALHNESTSQLEQGKQLAIIRKILEPHKMFLSHIRANFGMSRATAYRRIDEYEKASRRLKKPVLEVAMRRGYKTSQLRIVEDNPPPSDNPVEIGRHLDKLERTPREVKPQPEPVRINQDVILKECINFAWSRYEKLPHNGKTRAAWVRSLMGMLMTKFGFGAGQTFEPMAIPDAFRAVPRGRPRKVA